MATRYRKKPIEVDAMRLIKENVVAVEAFVDGRIQERKLPGPGRGLHDGVVITTLDRNMRAVWGDWVVRGAAGEVFPCRHDVFEATYEPVES